MKTSIAWTEFSWNPWIGCTKVSPGCAHCYAEQNLGAKMRRGGPVLWGPGQPRAKTLGWDQPAAINRRAEREGRVIPVFPSLCDVFDNDTDQRIQLDAWRDEFFDLIGRTPNIAWLILTKRPEVAVQPRWSKRIEACGGNLWIGASAEDQKAADERVPLLLRIPAKNRFVSAEPLLGPLDLTLWRGNLDWVIVGGESGPHARPMNLGWARKVRSDCAVSNTLFFFKQVGGPGKEKGGDRLDGEIVQQVPPFRAARLVPTPDNA